MGTQVALQEIFLSVWKERKIVLWSVLISLIVGFFIVIISPVEYESESRLLIETNNGQTEGNQLLSQYGEMFGLSGMQGSSSTLSPDLYPEIIQGLTFQISLMKEDLRFEKADTSLSAYNYFRFLYDKPFTEIIASYTIGLPSKVQNIFSSDNEQKVALSGPMQKGTEKTIYSVTKDTLAVANELKDRVTVTVEKSNVLLVNASMPDPYAAANMGSNTVELLKTHIKNYRTKKAVQNLEYAQVQLQRAEKDFKDIQKRLAEFRDSNVNLSTAMAQTRLQQLESEYDLLFNIYNSLAKRVEELKLRVQEETPVFTTMEPFQVPQNNSKPNAKLILFVTVFLGLAGSIAYIVLRDQWQIFVNQQGLIKE